MNFFNQWVPWRKPRASVFSLVDVGQDAVKTAIVRANLARDGWQLIGLGLAETHGRTLAGGRAEAAAIRTAVNMALTEAEDQTEQIVGQKIVPDDVLFALPAQATQGQLYTIKQQRARPQDLVTVEELTQLNKRVERMVEQALLEQWRPLLMSEPAVRLDGQPVLHGVGLIGRELSLSLFGGGVHLGVVRAIERLVEDLGLNLVSTVPTIQALTQGIPQAAFIVLDVGHKGTNVYRVSNGMLTEAERLPFGGALLTKALAEIAETEYRKARALKHDFARAEATAQEEAWLEQCLAEPRNRWYAALDDLLHKFARLEPLPRHIYMTGGGSRLFQVDHWLRANSIPFDCAPVVLSYHNILRFENLVGEYDDNLFALTTGLIIGLPSL